jgi:hypothetical protein
MTDHAAGPELDCAVAAAIGQWKKWSIGIGQPNDYHEGFTRGLLDALAHECGLVLYGPAPDAAFQAAVPCDGIPRTTGATLPLALSRLVVAVAERRSK